MASGQYDAKFHAGSHHNFVFLVHFSLWRLGTHCKWWCSGAFEHGDDYTNTSNAMSGLFLPSSINPYFISCLRSCCASSAYGIGPQLEYLVPWMSKSGRRESVGTSVLPHWKLISTSAWNDIGPGSMNIPTSDISDPEMGCVGEDVCYHSVALLRPLLCIDKIDAYRPPLWHFWLPYYPYYPSESFALILRKAGLSFTHSHLYHPP
jgi:hypothetical protein